MFAGCIQKYKEDVIKNVYCIQSHREDVLKKNMYCIQNYKEDKLTDVYCVQNYKKKTYKKTHIASIELFHKTKSIFLVQRDS